MAWRVVEETNNSYKETKGEKNYEKTRDKYNPTNQNIKVKALFIGESPPRKTFFYHADSNLYYATKEAFERAYCKQINNFLLCFKDLGCYLIDLYSKPNKKAKSLCGWKGKQEKRKLVRWLAGMIQQLNPCFIIVVHERVCCWAILSAKEALKNLGSRANFNLNNVRCLPFPKCDCKDIYTNQLTEIINKELIPKGILPKNLPKPPC